MKKYCLATLGWLVSAFLGGFVGYAMKRPELRNSADQQSEGRPLVAPALTATPQGRTEPVSPLTAAVWPKGVPETGDELLEYSKRLLRDGTLLERTEGFLHLLRCATPENAQFLLQAYLELRAEGVFRTEVEQPMNYRMGQLRGKEILGNRLGSEYDLSVVYSLGVQLEGWTNANPAEARAWVEALPDGAYREKMIEYMVSFTAAKDPDGATALLASLPEDIQTNAAFEMGKRIRDKRGLGETLDYLAGIPADENGGAPGWSESTAAMLINEGIRVKQTGPGVAAALEGRLDQPFVTSDNLLGIGQSFVRFQPTEALAWALRVEAQGNEKAPPGSILGEMVQASYEDKLPVIEGWLGANPDLPGRDLVLLRLSERLFGTDPARARVWAEQITDPELRATVWQGQ